MTRRFVLLLTLFAWACGERSPNGKAGYMHDAGSHDAHAMPEGAGGTNGDGGSASAGEGGATLSEGGAAPAAGGVPAMAGRPGAIAGAGSGGVATSSGGASTSSGGTAPSSGGAAGATGVGGVIDGAPGDQPRIPPPPGSCPKLETGMVIVRGVQVELWVGARQAKPGPLLLYWHATASTADEAETLLGPAFQGVQDEGGIVASFVTTLMTGQSTSVGTWYTGDFVLADDVFACAVAQNLVNPRRVYTAGCSAGGFQAGAMVFARSSYLAAAMISSGGAIQSLTSTVFEEPKAIPAVITAYGDGSDILDFGVTSKAECDAVKTAGGMAVNCPYGNGHCNPPDAIRAAQWQFLKDHPFGVGPEPYRAGLPSSFPDACTLF